MMQKIQEVDSFFFKKYRFEYYLKVQNEILQNKKKCKRKEDKG